ncbi:MAG TPA: fibronectin type III domain-containing protein [Verrucomicrobiae bacterium]
MGLLLVCLAAGLRNAAAANVMNYGADGNDYYQFTTPSMAFDKASGFTTLITFAMHINPDGTLLIGGGVACTNGSYVGPANWGSLVATLKTPPTTVTRYEVCIGGWQDTSFANVESLIGAQGTGPGSILYKNFQALKNAVPGIDAINDDDEQTYDLGSSENFANMLGGLGYKFTIVPYTAQSFWVSLYHGITNCDYIYLQCYEGGAGNDPGNWDSAFGGGVLVIPGQESNTANPATFHNWYLETGVQGGFYYPDVVFNSTYWSADIIEDNGAVPAIPMGVTAVPSGRQVSLSWDMVPGAISYNVKRSISSGGETNIANVSTADNNWPASNEYTDSGLLDGTNYYYEISAVNTNGESGKSGEVSATPQAGTVNNASFELNATASGGVVTTVPTGWTAFNEAGASDIGSQNAGGTDYTIYAPLASPANGNQYCYVNMFNSSVTGGIYQDVGTLQANTIYTLTVAIGSRHDRINSHGMISLINGANNTGTVLASGGGLPAIQNSWQNYFATFTNGASASGDLTIALSVLGNSSTIQADFDNVRLVTTPVLPKLPKLAVPGVSGGNLILAGIGGTPGAGYTWLTTTSLLAPIHWTTNSIGNLDTNGNFSNSMPITANQPAQFFQFRMP